MSRSWVRLSPPASKIASTGPRRTKYTRYIQAHGRSAFLKPLLQPVSHRRDCPEKADEYGRESEPAPVDRAVCRTRQRSDLSGGFRSPTQCILSDTVRQDPRVVRWPSGCQTPSPLFHEAEIAGGASATSQRRCMYYPARRALHGAGVE